MSKNITKDELLDLIETGKIFGIIKTAKERGYTYAFINKKIKEFGLDLIGTKKFNRYDLSGDVGIIYDNNGVDFLFDIEDYDKVKDIRWYSKKTKDGHIYLENKKNSYKSFHKIVMNAENTYVDHINRNTRDNRKSNLRISTNQQNSFNCNLSKNNKSGYTGVSWDKSKQLWTAKIKVNYKDIYLGSSRNSIEEALILRLKGELKYIGVNFAPQRHLFEKYGIGVDSNE